MKIALLTVFDENYREIADRTLPSMRRYADIFGLEFLTMPPKAEGRPPLWGKIKCIREVLQSGFDYCLFVDADAIFVRFDEDIRNHITPGRDLSLCWHGPDNSESYGVIQGHFNTGVMLWRNCTWSIDFLDEIWRQTDFINHFWHEQAAMLHLLGYRKMLGLGGTDDPDPDRMAHVQELPVDWNVLVGSTIGPDPIIYHFAGRPKATRLLSLDREIALQPIRETLPPSARRLLSRQLNLIQHQTEQRLQQTEAHAAKAIAQHNALLRSRSRLARALWQAVRRKFGVSPHAAGGRTALKGEFPPDIADLRYLGIFHDLTAAALVRRAAITNDLITFYGLSVASGPFAGMTLLAEASWGDGDLSPKLLGCYEAELHPAIAKAVSRNPTAVVNIGCAEGYYAVGIARALPRAKVFAFDANEKAEAICLRAAAVNQVSNRVVVAGTCGIESLARIMSENERPLLIVDCEGAELQLLDPAHVPELLQCDMIIECHDFVDPQITAVLQKRFAASHDIEQVLEGPRDPNEFAGLQNSSSLDRWLAVNENRPNTMSWLVCWTLRR